MVDDEDEAKVNAFKIHLMEEALLPLDDDVLINGQDAQIDGSGKHGNVQ